MRQVRLIIEREAVQHHPVLHANADRGDLVLEALALVRPPYPNADSVFAALALHIEYGKGADDPFLDSNDETTHIRCAQVEIDHDVGDPLR